MSTSFSRIVSLTVKECRQLLRDRLTLCLELLVPIVQIVVFGYGISLDLKDIPVALVIPAESRSAADLSTAFSGSPYMKTFRTGNLQAANELFSKHEVRAMVILQPDFERRFGQGDAKVGVVINGSDAITATMTRMYLLSAVSSVLAKEADRGNQAAVSVLKNQIAVENRSWFNESNDSSWYLVPGLIAVVIALTGTFFSSATVAREWENGTMETLMASGASSVEIIAAKTVPYFLVGLAGLVLCVLASVFLFQVPVRGSLIGVSVIGMLFLLVQVTLGLFISSATKSQFVAAQISIITSLLPTVLLSGFIFDLRSVPEWIAAIANMLPCTYAVEALKILYLSGGSSGIVIRDAAVLVFFFILFFTLAVAKSPRKMG